MAKTLLDGVNDVLKRLKITSANQSTLTSLTDSARQVPIDITVQVWNEAINTLYDSSATPKPQEVGEQEITLALNTREYTLDAGVVQLRYPGLDETNGLFIAEYPGGYEQMRIDQPTPNDGYQGLPNFAVINPTNGKLRMDLRPQADDVGKVYKFLYDKDLVLTIATSTMPFTDATYRAMVPAVAQLVNRDLKRDFDEAIFIREIGQASRYLNQTQRRTHY